MKCLGLATLWITGKLFCVGLLLRIAQSNFYFVFIFLFRFVLLVLFFFFFLFSLSEIVFWHKQINLLFSFLRPASRVTPPFIQ